jgi:hypothetical protein
MKVRALFLGGLLGTDVWTAATVTGALAATRMGTCDARSR